MPICTVTVNHIYTRSLVSASQLLTHFTVTSHIAPFLLHSEHALALKLLIRQPPVLNSSPVLLLLHLLQYAVVLFADPKPCM
jgi:hypothetical protein